MRKVRKGVSHVTGRLGNVQHASDHRPLGGGGCDQLALRKLPGGAHGPQQAGKVSLVRAGSGDGPLSFSPELANVCGRQGTMPWQLRESPSHPLGKSWTAHSFHLPSSILRPSTPKCKPQSCPQPQAPSVPHRVHMLQDRPPRTLSRPQPHRLPPQSQPLASGSPQLPAACPHSQSGPQAPPRPQFALNPQLGPACKLDPPADPPGQPGAEPRLEAPNGQPSVARKCSMHSSSPREALELGQGLGQQGQQHPWKPGEQSLSLQQGAAHRGADARQPMEGQVMPCCWIWP